MKKCEFTGCKKQATWKAEKLWGKGGVIHTCDTHKPGGRQRPEGLKALPDFYKVTPIEGGPLA